MYTHIYISGQMLCHSRGLYLKAFSFSVHPQPQLHATTLPFTASETLPDTTNTPSRHCSVMVAGTPARET